MDPFFVRHHTIGKCAFSSTFEGISHSTPNVAKSMAFNEKRDVNQSNRQGEL